MQAVLKILSRHSKIVCSSKKALNKPKIEKELKDGIVKNKRKLFKIKKENKAIKDKIITDIRNLFELGNKDF